MKWSMKLGRIGGTTIRVHITFLLLIAWVAISDWHVTHNVYTLPLSIGFTLAVFVCIVLHEFGHVRMAKRFGIKTPDIILLPIGGISQMERMPTRPRQEFAIAVSGPAVTLCIASILYATMKAAGIPLLISAAADWNKASFVERLFFVNSGLLAFNLLPAFPLDGGRIFRSIAAAALGYKRGTRIATMLGHALALGLAVVGLLQDPFLLLIAMFIWIAATQEDLLTQIGSVSAVPVRNVAMTSFSTLSPSDRISRAVELILSGTQHDFPVVNHGEAVGLLTRRELIKALSERSLETSVSEIMQRGCPAMKESEFLEDALERLSSPDSPAIIVTDQGKIVGLVTMENIAEFLMIQSANEKRLKRTARSQAA